MRPFGEDEDDFELNYILDRHVRVAFAMVDTIRRLKVPDPVDTYVGHDIICLPHTLASSMVKEVAPKLKTDKIPKKGTRGADLYRFVADTAYTNLATSPDSVDSKRRNSRAAFQEAVKRFGTHIKQPQVAEVAEKLLEDDDISVHSLAV